MPHVGESDTDKLTDIPGRPAETDEQSKEEEEKEEEDEFGYNWSEFSLFFSENAACTILNPKSIHADNKAIAFSCENETEMNSLRSFPPLL